MDILPDEREGGASRSSLNINSPRPTTPIGKNRVHPVCDEQTENIRTEGARTTENDLSIPTEYVHVLEKSGTRDRLHAELAWLEEKGRPKRRKRLPSISGSHSGHQRKYSILEILQSQQQQASGYTNQSQQGASDDSG